MNFKIGDRVKIKSEEELIKEFGNHVYDDPPLIVDDMLCYLGNKYTISKFITENYIKFNEIEFEWKLEWLKKCSIINLPDKMFKL